MAKRRISALQRVGYIIETIFVVPIGWFIQILPHSFAMCLGKQVGKLIYHLSKHYKQVAMDNLNIVFTDHPLSEDKKKTILKKLYIHLGEGMVEYLRIGSVTAQNAEQFAEFENFEVVEKALTEGKGVLSVTLHMGNWEYSGSIPAKKGFSVGAIINRQFNPYTDAWLRRIREKKGKVQCFYNEVTDLRRINRHIKNNGIVAMLVDQTYYFKPIFVPFFGRTAATAEGPARFHLKYGSPIIMCHSYKMEDGRYKVIFEEPMKFDLTGDTNQDIHQIMTRINKRYEYYIREHPEQWFSLLHPRWEKTCIEDFADIDDDPYG